MKKFFSLCCLLILGSLGMLWAQNQILISDTDNDIIYTANLDGTGTPTALISPATGQTQGPVGMFADFTNNLLYITEGNGRYAVTAPLTGGSGTLIPNSTPPGGEHFDIYADVANSRYFFSTDNSNGISVANTSGVGAATPVRTSGANVGSVHGLDYNPATDLLYAAEIRDDDITVVNVATGVATTLFDAGDGVDGPRGLNIDPVNGWIYWSQHTGGGGTGSVWRGDINGTGSPTQLYASSSGLIPHGILIDYSTGLLYWVEFGSFGGPSNVMVAAADGSGTPSVLHSFPSTRLRGLEFGQPLQVQQQIVPTLSQWGLILLALGIVAMGTVMVWRRRNAYA